MVPDLDTDKPDPDPVWPDLDPSISGSGSGLPGGLSGPVQALISMDLIYSGEIYFWFVAGTA